MYYVRFAINCMFTVNCYFLLQANSVEITLGPGGIAAAPAKPTEMIDGKTRAQNVDKMARKVFPITFLLFNLFYWTYYGLPYSFNQDS